MKTNGMLLGTIGVLFAISTSCENEDVTSIDNRTYPEKAKLKRTLLYSSVNAKDPINIIDEYEYDNEGNVKKVSSPTYQNGEAVGVLKYDLYEYNSKGELAKISNYNANTSSPTGFINLKNSIYTYYDNTLKEKEFIEYPEINSSEYSLYHYDENQLHKIEKYNYKSELEVYIKLEYNDIGELIKETSYTSDNEIFSQTKHLYENGQNYKTETYSGTEMALVREINKTYDKNKNLVMIESNELMPYSSMASHVLKYEYYE